MYSKNHKKWLPVKESIDEEYKIKHYYRNGEIRWAAIGVNIGNEIDGKGDQFLRPVLILEKLSPWLYFVLPLSTKPDKDYLSVTKDNTNNLLLDSFIRLNKIATLDIKIIIRKIGNIEKYYYKKLIEAFINQFAL